MDTRDDRSPGAGRRAPRSGPPGASPPRSSSPGSTTSRTSPQRHSAPTPSGAPSDDVPEGGRPAGYRPSAGTTAANATRSIGRGIGRATTGAARLTARSGRYAAAKAHAYTHSGGAGESGLARVTELHATNTVGDTVMALALAGTLFFNPQTAQARSQVAMFLLLTMVPFALVAPLIGPLLDRFSHGRRWAIGTTMAVRAFLCWVLAEAIGNHSGWVFPAALGCLVASRAYTITRAAAVPRVLPAGTTLVRANSRNSMAGVVGAVIGGALGGLAMVAGPAWALRVAFVAFVVGTVQAIRLPEQVDSSEGELHPEDTTPIPVRSPRAPSADPGRDPNRDPNRYPNRDPNRDPNRAPASSLRGTQRRWTAGLAGRHTDPGARPGDDDGGAITIDSLGIIGRFRRRKQAIPWPVKHALWSTGGTRVLTGFIITFMAFLAREHPLDGMRAELVLGLVAAAIGVGNGLGSLVGNVVKDDRPERVAMLSVLAATLCCIATAIWYGIATLIMLGLVLGLSSQLAKLCFDALVQREVPENVRTSVFAWSETMLQILWVAGGALGIMLPLNPYIGFSVCAAALVWTVLMAARQRRVAGRPTTTPRVRRA